MKKLIALLLAVVMVLGLVACAAKTEAPKAEEKKEEAAPAVEEKKEDAPKEEAPKEEAPAEEEHEEVTLEVWLAQVDWADAWDELEAKFEDEYPWIEIEHVGLGEENFIQQRIAANDIPAAVQLNNNEVMQAMLKDDRLIDLKDWDCAKLMSPTYADAYTFDGKMVGMCQGAAYSCMFYNMDILAQAGWDTIPTNWDELLQCCADIAEKTDAAPLTTAAGKTTTSWMIFELILGNEMDEATRATYVDDFKNGTFDFGQFPAVAEKLDAIAPYFLEGSASAQEEDVASYMGDGLAAMCIAGNWNNGMILPAIAEACGGDESKAMASLPPFNNPGQPVVISNSPEDAFCLTKDENRTEAESEALEIFFNWLFEAENYKFIQNARGSTPVITNMTEEYIELAPIMVPVVADVAAAPAILMGFNMWSAEFKDAANVKIRGVLTGDNTAQDAIDTMNATVVEYYKNK